MRKTGVRKSRRGLRKHRNTFRRGRLGGSAPVFATNPGMAMNTPDKPALTNAKLMPQIAANPGLMTNAPVPSVASVPSVQMPVAPPTQLMSANPGLVTNAPVPPMPLPPVQMPPVDPSLVFKPTMGQFGAQNPNQVSLTGDFTEYQMGLPGLGVRGFTQPGANPFAPGALQHTSLTGYGQAAQVVAGLALPGTKVPSTFDPSQAPPDYYTPLGLVNNHTPIPKSELDAAYAKRKNAGSNTDKQVAKNAYNTLSDPAKRYKYDQAVTEYLTAHPPSLSNIMAMASKSGARAPGGLPLNTGLKMLSWIPGFSSAMTNPINTRRR